MRLSSSSSMARLISDRTVAGQSISSPGIAGLQCSLPWVSLLKKATFCEATAMHTRLALLPRLLQPSPRFSHRVSDWSGGQEISLWAALYIYILTYVGSFFESLFGLVCFNLVLGIVEVVFVVFVVEFEWDIYQYRVVFHLWHLFLSNLIPLV